MAAKLTIGFLGAGKMATALAKTNRTNCYLPFLEATVRMETMCNGAKVSM